MMTRHAGVTLDLLGGVRIFALLTGVAVHSRWLAVKAWLTFAFVEKRPGYEPIAFLLQLLRSGLCIGSAHGE